MAEKDLVIREKLEHSGVFDFAALYSYVHEWFKTQGYGVLEEKYGEKVVSGSRDITAEWKATKTTSDYFKIEIALKIEGGGVTEVEAEIGGIKKKMNRGKVSFDFKGALVRDPKNKWEDSPTYKMLRDWYDKYIIPEKIKKMEEQTATDVRDVKEAIKRYVEAAGRR